MINAEMLFLSFDARETDDEQAAHEQVLVEQLLNPNLHQRQLQSASVTALLNLTPNAFRLIPKTSPQLCATIATRILLQPPKEPL